MKLHKIAMFFQILFILQIFASLLGVSGNDYFYGVEEGYGDIGAEMVGDGVGIDSFVPMEFDSEHKQTFTSARIIDIGVFGYQNRQTSTSGSNDSSSFIDEDPSGSAFPTVVYDRKFHSKLSKTGDHVFGSILIAIGLTSVVGNGCILFVFCFRRRRLSPAEVFLVNLGIADILLSIASYPLTMISSFKHRWDFEELGCTLYAFVCYFLGLASIFSITGIALIRYMKTCTPVKGNQITCLTSCKMIAWGYIFALVWALPPLIGFGNYELEPFGLSCTLDWVARDQASKIYMVLVTIFCVFLPLLIILFCYCQIILLVKQSDALVRSNGVNKRNMKGSDLQLTWISGLVSLGFIIGWGPYTVVSLWASYRGEVILPIWATPIPVLLAKSSIAYNPFIYIFFTARYREDFISLCRAYGKVSTGKTNGDRFPNSGPNGGGGNNNGDESPGNSGSSSLVTRQYTNTTATNSQNNNNNTPNHDNYPRRSEEEELIPVYDELASPSLSNGYDRGGTITANMLNAMDQQNEGLCHHQELSIVVVRDPSTSAHAITMINGVPPTKKLVLPFKKVLKEEQV